MFTKSSVTLKTFKHAAITQSFIGLLMLLSGCDLATTEANHKPDGAQTVMVESPSQLKKQGMRLRLPDLPRGALRKAMAENTYGRYFNYELTSFTSGEITSNSFDLQYNGGQPVVVNNLRTGTYTLRVFLSTESGEVTHESISTVDIFPNTITDVRLSLMRLETGVLSICVDVEGITNQIDCTPTEPKPTENIPLVQFSTCFDLVRKDPFYLRDTGKVRLQADPSYIKGYVEWGDGERVAVIQAHAIRDEYSKITELEVELEETDGSRVMFKGSLDFLGNSIGGYEWKSIQGGSILGNYELYSRPCPY